MLDKFKTLYIFQKEGALRVSVVRLDRGKRVKGYVLFGLSACTCPGFQKTPNCKHRQMWNGEFIRDEVPTDKVVAFTVDLLESLSIPYEGSPEAVNMTTGKITLALSAKKLGVPFDKAVGIVDIEGKELVVEIRRM